MNKRFTCPLGHRWELTIDDRIGLAVQAISCPECGGPAETLPPCESPAASASRNTDSATQDVRRAINREAATLPPRNPIELAESLTPSDSQPIEPVSKRVRASVRAPDNYIRYFGDYELLTEIARGGMGVVYKARQVKLNRLVAVKMILAGQLASGADVERFHAEATAAANLQHPNIVAIYEIGEHAGQHYFSMEYVDGRSLAEFVRENPLPPKEAARIVSIIADAVHYAHQRGVLHRDLKPSNILMEGRESRDESRGQESSRPETSSFGSRPSTLDPRPRITDFGLAKRIEGGSDLTGTGQVLGTPSYMPPEQAAGKRGALGPHSDVYSLGAILYELVTGRPPFRAETPLDTIMQVLEADPVSPRLLNPKLPKDVETICLKCLHKVPKLRYPTAAELAHDLRRFSNGEPIRARPVSAPERLLYWTKRQRRSVGLTIGAVVATVLLGIVGLASWYSIRTARLGQIAFTTNGPALLAEVYDPSGQLVARDAFPTKPLPLPAGPYDVRISGRGKFSRVFQTDVERRATVTFGVELSDQYLWKSPIKLSAQDEFQVVELDGAPHVLLLPRDESTATLARLDPRTGSELWRVSWIPDKPELGGTTRPDDAPNWRRLFENWRNPMLPNRLDWLTTTPLLNPDGAAYLIRATKQHFVLEGATNQVMRSLDHQFELLAVSANDGRVLWRLHPKPPAAAGAVATLAGIDSVLSVASLDDDESADLIVLCSWRAAPDGGTMQACIEAVSGRTGEPLWHFEIPDGWIQDDEQPPHPPVVVSVDGRPVIAIADRKRLELLDAVAGQPIRARVEFDAVMSLPPQVIDVDGDGRAEELLVSLDGMLTAFSLNTQGSIWQLPLPIYFGAGSDRGPVRADLDNDARPEIVVPVQQPIGSVAPWNTMNIAGLEVLDGQTGMLRFRRLGPTLRHALVGPDLNGDGSRELFVIGPHPNGSSLGVYVHALSGTDGTTVWWKKLDQWRPFGNLAQPRWWQTGPDGWPQLMVCFSDGTIVMAASDGRVVSEAEGARVAHVADFNADGIPDLCTFVNDYPGTGAGRCQIVRGEPPVRWTRLSSPKPAGDFDGDGYVDLLEEHFQQAEITLRTVSGRTGRVLTTFRGTPVGGGDVNGDNVAEIIVRPQSWNRWSIPLQALSGRTGKQLWTGPAMPPEAHTRSDIAGATWNLHDWFLVGVVDIDGDGAPDVIAAGMASYQPKPAGNVFPIVTTLAATSPIEQHSWLAVFSGRDSQLRWARPTGPTADAGISGYSAAAPPTIADLDGDGVRDLVFGVPAASGPGRVTRKIIAFNGKNGDILWDVRLTDWPIIFNPQYPEQVVQFPTVNDLCFTPLVEDLDGDGAVEVVAFDCTIEIAKGIADASSELLGVREMVQGAAPEPETSSDSPFAISDPIRVLALDARSGRQIGGWQGSKQPYKTAPGELLKLVSVPFGPGGKPAAMLLIRDARVAPETVLFDAQLHERALLENRGVDWNVIRAPQTADLDGDGSNDLVFENGSAVWAARGGTGEVLWRWPTTNAAANETNLGTWSVREILADPNGASAIVVVQLQRDDMGQGNVGLDGRTGTPLWRCDGWPVLSPPFQKRSGAAFQSLANPPLVARHIPNEDSYLGGEAFAFACEMSLPTDPTGRFSSPANPPLSFNRAAAYPWELRSLPWTLGPTATGTALFRVAGFVAAHALVLLIMPGWLVFWAVRNRTWTLSVLLGLPVVVALAIAFVQFSEANSVRLDDLQFGQTDSVGQDSRLSVMCYRASPTSMRRDFNKIGIVPSDVGGRLMRLTTFAATGLPVLAFPYLLIGGLFGGRVWRVGSLLGLSCLLSIAVAMLLLWDDRQWLASFQQYSRDGWYFVWFIGAYVTTFLFLIAVVGSFALQSVIRRFRSLLGTHAVSSLD